VNILVLDDEKAVCDLFKSRLEMEGFLCMTANSIEEAWTKTRILRFDVLIIDLLLLPGSTRGDQFGREYRKRYPWARVIYVTGLENPTPPELEDQVFIKPVDFDELITSINIDPPQRPHEIPTGSIKLDGRDSMMIMELVNKVVEHTNIVATSQALITENLEQIVAAQERSEDKFTYIYKMLQQIEGSGMLKAFTKVSGFIRKVIREVFWAVVALIGIWLLKGPLLTLINEVFKKM